MIIISNIDRDKFSLNGIPYFKNFMPHSIGTKLRIVNVYDSVFELVPFASVDQYNVNGVVYTTILALQTALISIVYSRDTLGAVNEFFLGSVVPTDTPTGTGKAFWNATQAGTYTNFGGKVVNANSFAVISRDSAGVFSISQTAFDITTKVNVSDVVDNLTSTDTNKPLSAKQGKILNEKNIKIEPWTAKVYASGDQVNYLGKDWVSNAATVSGDVPGTSTKWNIRLTASENKADLVVGKNLFDKTKATAGYYISDTTGLLTGGGSFPASVSEFIPATAGTIYYWNGYLYSAFYDANKNYISGSSTAFPKTAPAGTAFIRVTSETATLNTTQLEIGSVATIYESYYKQVQPNQLYLKDYTKTADLAIKTAFDTRLKADFTQSKNLFDKSTITDGYYFNPSTGALVALATVFVSDFIPVNEGSQYYFNTNRYYTCFYDINKVFISGTGAAFPLTVPAGAKYIRVTGNTGSQNIHQFELGAVATFYEPYSIKFDNLKNDKVPALVVSKNLFVVETSIVNSFISWLDGSVAAGYPQGIASDFIPVVAGSVYACNSTETFKAFYNSSKVFVSGSQSGTYPVTIPAGCAFIRITIGAAQKYTAQFEVGSVQTSYARGGYNSIYPYYSDEPVTIKKLVTIGDSITQMNAWQPKVILKLNLSHTNLGISGTALAGGTDGAAPGDGMWTTQRIAQIPADTDIIILNGGINDYARNYVIGVIGSTNTAEFYGALNKWVERAMAQAPNAKIFIATTTYGECGSFSSDPNYANAGGNSSKEYATAMKNIAYKYGFPIIDFQGCCMVNKWNRAAMAPDGLHPGTEYANRMANVAINVIINLK